MPDEVTLDILKGFLDAFNRHDLDAIMEYFHDDCVFYMPRGKRPRGDRTAGRPTGLIRLPNTVLHPTRCALLRARVNTIVGRRGHPNERGLT